MTKAFMIAIKRVYETPNSADGYRVLVDRLWPRGLTKKAAAVDEWLKDLAPSTTLRKRFDHRAERWDEFTKLYREELAGTATLPLMLRLATISKSQHVTLLYAAQDEIHNQAFVIAAILKAF